MFLAGILLGITIAAILIVGGLILYLIYTS